MTPETDNAIRAACRRCTEEIQQAMRKKPKPNWNETVPPIINKHHKKIEALGVTAMTSQITGSLKRPFLLLAFTFNRINRQFQEH